jgi:hypothetical protein
VFRKFELRAHDQDIALGDVPLIIEEPADSVLSCTWSATAEGVAGKDTGTFTLTVGESTFEAE